MFRFAVWGLVAVIAVAVSGFNCCFPSLFVLFGCFCGLVIVYFGWIGVVGICWLLYLLCTLVSFLLVDAVGIGVLASLVVNDAGCGWMIWWFIWRVGLYFILVYSFRLGGVVFGCDAFAGASLYFVMVNSVV